MDLHAEAAINGVRYGGSVRAIRSRQGRFRIAVQFEAFPPLRAGSRILLGLTEGLLERLSLEAILIARRQLDGRVRCLFDAGPRRAAPGSANTRGSVRIRPSPSAPARMRVENHDAEFVVRDLSVGGLSLVLPKDAELPLAVGAVGSISLVLPGEPAPLDLVARVRNRRLFGGSILYGLQFEAGATPGFAYKETRLQRYLVRRQQQMIRIARRTGGAAVADDFDDPPARERV